MLAAGKVFEAAVDGPLSLGRDHVAGGGGVAVAGRLVSLAQQRQRQRGGRRGEEVTAGDIHRHRSSSVPAFGYPLACAAGSQGSPQRKQGDNRKRFDPTSSCSARRCSSSTASGGRCTSA